MMSEITNVHDPFEDIRVILREIAESNKAANARLDREAAESRAKNEAASARFDKEMAESRAKNEEASARFDKEMAESRAKNEEASARFDKEMAESRAKNEEASARFDKEMAESRAEWEKRIKKLEENVGGIANNNGFIAEEYFSNSFERGKKNFFGEKFDDMERNVKGIDPDYKDEYDILLINGKSVGIIEVKYKAHDTDIHKVLNKAHTFRINFPKYQNHQCYLGLASMAFYPQLEKECIERGIAIIKQVGDVVVIKDEHLKAY